MGQLIEFFRAKYPNDTATDRDVLFRYAHEQGEDYLRKYPQDHATYLEHLGALNPLSNWEEFNRGGRRSWEGTKGTFKAAGSMFATALGAEDTGTDWLKAAQKNYQKASLPEYRSSGSAPISALIGEAAPSLLESIGTGVAGAALGAALVPAPDPGDVVTIPVGFVAGLLSKNAIKKELRARIIRELGPLEATEKAVKLQLKKELADAGGDFAKAAARRGIAGEAGQLALTAHKKLLFQQSAGMMATGLNSVGLSAGEIYSQLAADPDVDLDTAFNHAFWGGIVAGIPDTILPAFILGKTLKALKGGSAPITRKATDSTYRRIMDSWPGRLTKATAGGGTIEAGTEAFQTWVGIIAEKSAKGMSVNDAIADSNWDNLTWSQRHEMIHAAKVGFVAGVMGGGGGEIFSSLAGGAQPPVDAEPEATPATPAPALEGADPVPVDVAHIDHEQQAKIDALVAAEMEDTAVLDADGNLIEFRDPSEELFKLINMLSREDADESLRDYYVSQKALARAAFTRAPVDAVPVTLENAPPEVVEAAEATAAELLPGIDNTGKKATVKLTPVDRMAAASGQTTPPGIPLVRDDGVEVLSFTQRGGESEGSGEPAQLTPAVPPTRVVIPPVEPPKIKTIKPQAKEERDEVLKANIAGVVTNLETNVKDLEAKIEGIHAKLEKMKPEEQKMELNEVPSYSGVVVNELTGESETIVRYGNDGLAELDKMGANNITMLPQSNTVSMTLKLQKQLEKLQQLRDIQSGDLNVLDDNFPTELLAWQTQEIDKSDRSRTESNTPPGTSISYPAFYDRSDEDAGTEAGDELRTLLDAVFAEQKELGKKFDPKDSAALTALGDMLTSEGRVQKRDETKTSVKSDTTRMVVLRKLNAKPGDSDAYHIVPIHKGNPKVKKSQYNVTKPTGEPVKGAKTLTLEEALEGYDIVGSIRMSVPISSSKKPVRYSLTAKQWTSIAADLRSRRQQSASKTGVGEWTPPTSTSPAALEDETQIQIESLERQSRLEVDSETGEAQADQDAGNVPTATDPEVAVEIDPEEAAAAAQALANLIQTEVSEDKHAHHSEAPDLSVPVKEWVDDSVAHLLSEGLAIDNGEIALQLLLDKTIGVGLSKQDPNTQKEASDYWVDHGLVALLAKFNAEIQNTKEQHERNQAAEVAGETGQEGSATPDAGPGSDSVRTAHQEASEQDLSEADLTPSDGTTLVHAQELTSEGEVVDVEASVVPDTKQAVDQNAKADQNKKEQQKNEERNNLISREALKKLEQTPTDTREKGVVKALEEYLDKHPELQGIVELVRGPGPQSDSDTEFWAARLQEDGTIAINLNLIQASEIKSNIDHELGHYIYGSGEFTQAFEALWGSLSEAQQNKISVEVARLYGSELATEEERVRALQFIREETLQTEEQRTLWDKLVALLENIYRKLTGGQHSDPQTLAAHMVAHAREAIVTGHQRGDTTVERYNRQAIASLQDPDATLLSFYDTFENLNWPPLEEYKDWKLAGKPMVTSRTSIEAGQQKKVKTAEEIDDIAQLILGALAGSAQSLESIHGAHFPNIEVNPTKLSIEQFFVDAETREPLDMSDPLQFIRASDAGQQYWTVQQENPDALHDALVEEARRIILDRIKAIQRLSEYLENMVEKRGDIFDDLAPPVAAYTYTEALMIVHHAAKFSYGVDGKQDKIGVDNRHPVMDLRGVGAAYIRDALREGKPIKQAFKEAAIKMDEEAKQIGVKSNKNGWHTFKQSDKAEDVAALMVASAGTSWCIRNEGTAGDYLEKGDHHAYYVDGEVQVMIRMEGDQLAKSDQAPRGRLPGQEVHEDYADIAEDYLRSNKIKGGEEYLHDRDFVRALKKLRPGMKPSDVDPILRDALYEVTVTELDGETLTTRSASIAHGIKRRAPGHGDKHYPTEVTQAILDALTDKGNIPLDVPIDADGVLTGDVVINRRVDAETAKEVIPRLPDGVLHITGDIKFSDDGVRDATGVRWAQPPRRLADGGLALDTGDLEILDGGFIGLDPVPYTGNNRLGSIVAPNLRAIGEIKNSHKDDEFPVLAKVRSFSMPTLTPDSEAKTDWLHLPELVEVVDVKSISKVDAPKLKVIPVSTGSGRADIYYSHLPALQTVEGNLTLVGTNIEQEVELAGWSALQKQEYIGETDFEHANEPSGAALSLRDGSTIKLKNHSIDRLVIRGEVGAIAWRRRTFDLGRLRKVNQLEAESAVIPGITEVTMDVDPFTARSVDGEFMISDVEMADLETVGGTARTFPPWPRRVSDHDKVIMKGRIILPKLTKVHASLEISINHEVLNTDNRHADKGDFNLGKLKEVTGQLKIQTHGAARALDEGSFGALDEGSFGTPYFNGYIPLPSLKEVDRLNNSVAIHAPKLKKVGEAPSKNHLKTFYPNVLHDKAVIKEASDEYIDEAQPAKPFWAGDSMPYSQWLDLRRTGYRPIGVPPKHVSEMTPPERQEWDAQIKEWMSRGTAWQDVLTDDRAKMNINPRTGERQASVLDPHPGEEANQVMRQMRKDYPDVEAFLTNWVQQGQGKISNKLFAALVKIILKSGLARGVNLKLVKQRRSNDGKLGGFNEEGGITIYVGDHESLEQMQETVMHEVLHSILVRSIANFNNHRGDKLPLGTIRLFEKLEGMLMRARAAYEQKVGKKVDFNSEGLYGLKNLDEFTSEAMTDPEFQAFLEGIPGQTGGENFLQSLIGVLKNIILDVLRDLGLKDGAGEFDVSDTLLGEVIETTLLAIHKTDQRGKPNESVAESNIRFIGRESGIGAAKEAEMREAILGSTTLHKTVRLPRDPRISAPEKDASKDSIDNELSLRLNFAAWSKVNKVLKEMFAKINLDQLNQDGIDFKKFISTFARISNTPEQMMALINQRLIDNEDTPIEGELDINDVVNKDRASHDAYQVLYDIFLHMQKHRAKSENRVNNELAALEASNAELQQLLSDYENAATLTKASDKALRNFITSLSRKTPAAQQGMLSKVAAHLKKKGVDIAAMTRVQKILAPKIDGTKSKEAVRREKESAMNKLMNLVDSVAALGIDFRAQGIGETVALIESNISPELQAVLDSITLSKDDQTAALVLMAYTGQSNQHIFDLSALRKIENRGSINDILKLAMSADKTAVNKAREAIPLLKTNAVLAERLLAKVREHKKAHRKRVKGMRDARAYIDFDNSTRRIIVGEMAALESALSIEQRPDRKGLEGSSLWEGTEGSAYLVPTSADQSSASLLKNPEEKLTLVPRKGLYGKSMTADEYHSKLVGEMEAMFLWLNLPNRVHDSTYAFVERTYNVISGEHIAREYSARRNNVILAAIGTFRDDLERTGSPVLKNIIHRLAQFVAFSKRHRVLEPLSHDWVLAERKAINALGLDKEANAKRTFDELVYNPALAFFEANQQILEEAGSPEEAINIGLRKVKEMLLASGTKASVALKRNPEAWARIEELLRLTGKMSKAIIEQQEEMGLKVKHGRGKREHWRRAIGAELFTVSRNIHGRITTRIIEMSKEGSNWMHKWTKTNDDGSESSGRSTRRVKEVRESTVAAYLGTDEEQAGLRSAAMEQTSGEVWYEFVRPLVEQDGESVFDEGGTRGDEDNLYHRLAARSDVMEAFSSVEEGDVIGFAEKLYELTGGDMSGDQASQEAMAEHVGKVAAKLQEMFNTLHQNIKQTSNPDEIRDTGQQLRRVMLDARGMEGFPKEWVKFSTFEEQQVLSIMRVFSAHAAFGQRMEPLKAEFKMAEQEFNDQVAMMESLSIAIANGLPKSEAKQKARDAYGPGGWNVLRGAADNLKGLQRIEDQIGAMIANEAAATPVEMGSAYEMLQMLTGLVVQSFKTAIIDTSSMFVMPFAKYGLNRVGFRESFKGFNTLVQAVGSFFQAFGRQVDMDAGWQTKYNELNLGDQDAMRGGLTRIVAAMSREIPGLEMEPEGVVEKTKNTLQAGAVKFSRAIREILGTGIMGFGKMEHAQRYATLHPQAVFTQAGLWMTAANTTNTWKAYHQLVTDAVAYLDRTPGADPGKRFTHKNLNMPEQAFGYMVSSLADYGMSLEGLARNARGKRIAGTKSEVFTNDQLRLLAVLAQADITKETSLMSRPSGVFANPLFRAMNPLVGWSVEKTADVARNAKWKDEAGEYSYRLMLQSAMPYLAMMPISLAFVWLRERWEEKALRKKANMLEFKWDDDNPVVSKHNALATLDRFNRVGVFGIAGDVANSSINVATGRKFTIENRIFFTSIIVGSGTQLAYWLGSGRPMDYQQGVRPGLQAVGLGGYLEWAQILNTVTGDSTGLPGLSQEAKVTKRLNVENWMRVAGRTQELDVRPPWTGYTQPQLKKPHLKNMALGAISNDLNMFNEALENARRVIREEHLKDPDNKGVAIEEEELESQIRTAFRANHPVRKVFRTLPTGAQYKALMEAIPEGFRSDIEAAVEMYNSYGELHLGIEPWRGKLLPKAPGQRRKKRKRTGADIRKQIMRGATGRGSGSTRSGDRRKEIMRKALGY